MDKLNPGYKFLSLLIVSLVLSFTYSAELNLAVFGLCSAGALLTPNQYDAGRAACCRCDPRGISNNAWLYLRKVRRFTLGLLPFLLVAAELFVSGLLFPAGGDASVTGSWGTTAVTANSLTAAMQLASRVLAFGSLGLLFALTTVPFDLVMSLMQQFRMPPKFAYGLLAAYHFLPTIRREYSIVRAAQKVRGVKASPLSAKTLLPMLVHAFERAESVAMAMESRGFCDKAPRGCAFPVRLGAVDFVFLALSVGSIVAGVVFL